MPRAQSALAYVNAGFLFKMNRNNTISEARMVYGGIMPTIRAGNCEKFLQGKDLFTNKTLQAAIQILQRELIIKMNPHDTSIEYRKQVAVGLFYKVNIQFFTLTMKLTNLTKT